MTEEACTHSYTGVLLDGYCSFHWPIYRIRARDARIRRLEEGLRTIRDYCGERAEAGARGDWDGLVDVAEIALVD